VELESALSAEPRVTRQRRGRSIRRASATRLGSAFTIQPGNPMPSPSRRSVRRITFPIWPPRGSQRASMAVRDILRFRKPRQRIQDDLSGSQRRPYSGRRDRSAGWLQGANGNQSRCWRRRRMPLFVGDHDSQYVRIRRTAPSITATCHGVSQMAGAMSAFRRCTNHSRIRPQYRIRRDFLNAS
jgi:hypothetical protein